MKGTFPPAGAAQIFNCYPLIRRLQNKMTFNNVIHELTGIFQLLCTLPFRFNGRSNFLKFLTVSLIFSGLKSANSRGNSKPSFLKASILLSSSSNIILKKSPFSWARNNLGWMRRQRSTC